MKKISELVNRACARELERVRPVAVNEKAVRAKTFAKLGMDIPQTADGKRKKGLRATLVSVGAVAACVALLFTVNAAFPAFAESLPGIGGLFRAINEHNRPAVYNEKNISRVEERMAPVSKAKSATAEGDLKFTVQEAYYDGKSLYCAAEIETELDPNAPKTAWDYEVYINGVRLDFDYRPLSREWVKTGENTYANDEMSTLIPEEYRPETPGDIQVKYVVTFSDLSQTKPAQDTHGQSVTEIIPRTLGSATTEFTAKYDPGETVEIQTDAEQNGVKLLSFTTSPSSTEVAMDVPLAVSGQGESGYADIFLFLENGEQVDLNSSARGYSDFSEDFLKITSSGEGIPRGETKAVVMLMYAEGNGRPTEGVVAAEFTVDLKEKTAVPSERWKNPDGPLYWNEEAALSSPRVFTSYRAPDSALKDLKNGYRVEFLSYMDGLPAPLLNLVTDQDYRELQVELLDEDGVVWTSAQTRKTQELSGYFEPAERILFQPFADYDFRYYDAFQNQMERATQEEIETYRELFGNQRLNQITGGEISREMDKSGLNSQTVFLDWGDHFPLAGEKYAVRLTDPQTGEQVYEETVEMSLPEQVELQEGQRIVKLRGPYNPYVIIDREP